MAAFLMEKPRVTPTTQGKQLAVSMIPTLAHVHLFNILFLRAYETVRRWIGAMQARFMPSMSLLAVGMMNGRRNKQFDE
ncbi:hypothetical protein E4U54_002177 [Claviceps lovelessii]|nr:hypothetical protein E4U54_002177 [Claviceps lovelessii]